MDNLTEEKRNKLKKWIAVGSLSVVGLIVSPIIFLTIQGLAGLAVAGAIGFTMISFVPWFQLKVANFAYRAVETEKIEHIKKVVASAEENPIETLMNLLAAKRVAFAEFKKNVETSTAARDTFKGKVKKFAERYPARAAEFQAQLDRMVLLVERKGQALKDAQQSLNDGDMKLEEMKAYWEMSKDAIELNKAAGMDTGDAFEKLKADTACDAVFESMNTAFAQLEVAALLDVDSVDKSVANVAQLGHSEPVTLNAVASNVRETVARK